MWGRNKQWECILLLHHYAKDSFLGSITAFKATVVGKGLLVLFWVHVKASAAARNSLYFQNRADNLTYWTFLPSPLLPEDQFMNACCVSERFLCQTLGVCVEICVSVGQIRTKQQSKYTCRTGWIKTLMLGIATGKLFNSTFLALWPLHFPKLCTRLFLLYIVRIRIQ